MTPRVSPRSTFSSSSVAPKRRAPACAAAAAPLLLLALAGRADATCTAYVHNSLPSPIEMDAYNGWDGSCGAPIHIFSVDGDGGFNYADCIDANGCKLKIAGSDSCDGTVYVPCGDELKFFVDANGNPDFTIAAKTDDNTRLLLLAGEEADADKAAVLSPLLALSDGGDVADFASSAEGEAEDVTISSLRGTKGSKRTL